MSDLDHARELLEMARGDLDALTGMLSEGLQDYFSDEVFGFHAQQTAEKLLKAWIALRGGQYPRSHDLMIFIQILSNLGENVTGLDELIDLNPFAVQYRYESLADDDEELDRASSFTTLKSLFGKVERIITIAHT